jgi:putative sigma-54 modulation protein
MQVHITFRHIESTEAIKNHVNEKLEKFKKYLIRPIDVHVILEVEKTRQLCEMTMQAKDFKAVSNAESDDLYKSIDESVAKLERQVQKHKDTIKHHKGHTPIHDVAAESVDNHLNKAD